MTTAINLNVEIKGQGYPILCLHGHPGSGKSMSIFTDHLSRRFQTLAPDLRGYGKSYYQQPFQMSDHLTDLKTLLDRYNIEKCLLLGWSLGGILALELILSDPQRFSGLILIASAARPFGGYMPLNWVDYLFTGVGGLINWLKPGWQWNIDTFGRRSLFRYLFSQHTPVAYQYLSADGTRAYLQTSQFAHRALAMALQSGYNRLAHLSNIDVPCLVLAGENDQHITCQSSQETAQALNHASWHCYPHTAHLFLGKFPPRFVKILILG